MNYEANLLKLSEFYRTIPIMIASNEKFNTKAFHSIATHHIQNYISCHIITKYIPSAKCALYQKVRNKINIMKKKNKTTKKERLNINSNR